MTFALVIIALILAGLFVTWVVNLTIKKLKKKAEEKLALGRGHKWIISELKALAKDPQTNTMSLDELDRLADEEGYTYAAALIDDNGEVVGDVELVKKEDKNAATDPAVEKLFRMKNGTLILEN